MKRFYVLLAIIAVAAVVFLVYSARRPAAAPTAATGPAPIVTDTFPGYTLGSPTAPVEITEYVDYECPICAEFATVQFPVVRQQLINTGKVRWRIRDFPLSIHAHSRLAAMAANCAGEQGKFWEMSDAIFSHHDWALQDGDPSGQFRDDAKALGVNLDQYDACMSSQRYANRITASEQEGEARGVSGTPTLFINGKEYTAGDRSSDALAAVVDSIIAHSKPAAKR